MIADAFEAAIHSLGNDDRVLLLLRYDQELQVREIAEIEGVHPSTITRRLQQLHERLHNDVVSTLANKYHLGSEAIKECMADILENPAHSIVTLIKQR